ncbi:uncharacterized protein LOC110812938 isoform X2 [Carica papaya]|uniref:uncharacterized protein LOC110812938 isoform X2 n=1 Tax=Carica papaya TaxID=3649 RepID=UPI000B8C985F|nr:uncharacterized protein LOC110812938 isoform X2 [Carica papaya]
MNCVNTLPFSSSSPYFTMKTSPRNIPSLYFSTPKRRRSRASRRISTTKPVDNSNCNNKTILVIPSSDAQNLSLVLDLNQVTAVASSRFHQFLDLGREAYLDLQSLITIDDNRRIVVSCRRKTMQFVGSLVVLGFLFVFAIRILVKICSAFRRGFESKPNVVVRRDRSLGGREVIVGIKKNDQEFRSSRNPVSLGQVFERRPTSYRVRVKEKLPKWWPESVATWTSVVNKEDYQKEANRLIRVIMDNRTGGKDIMEDDIIQELETGKMVGYATLQDGSMCQRRLRRVCRIAGVGVTIDPINTRDSFYRTSVEFVLNVCSRAPFQSTSVEIDYEDAREFIAGLAENIGLEKIRAARMVSAAVAARTRSCFLQAWALEMQCKHDEAVLELSKICLVHRIFPPDEFSPEMEMVARGLEKLMKAEERKFLMDLFVRVCGEEARRSAAEALGLVEIEGRKLDSN